MIKVVTLDNFRMVIGGSAPMQKPQETTRDKERKLKREEKRDKLRYEKKGR